MNDAAKFRVNQDLLRSYLATMKDETGDFDEGGLHDNLRTAHPAVRIPEQDSDSYIQHYKGNHGPRTYLSKEKRLARTVLRRRNKI